MILCKGNLLGHEGRRSLLAGIRSGCVKISVALRVESGHAEVDENTNERVGLRQDSHILRLDVSMNEAKVMNVLEAIEYHVGDACGLSNVNLSIGTLLNQ